MTTTNAPNGRARIFSTAAEVDRLSEPGRYKDTKTPGVYLQITASKAEGKLAKSYFYAFKFAGRSDTLGQRRAALVRYRAWLNGEEPASNVVPLRATG